MGHYGRSGPLDRRPLSPCDESLGRGLAVLGSRCPQHAKRRGRARPGLLPIAELKPLWTLTTDGNVAATPAVVDGMVYAPDFGGSLWAVDAATTCALSRAGQNRRSEGEGFAVIRRTNPARLFVTTAICALLPFLQRLVHHYWCGTIPQKSGWLAERFLRSKAVLYKEDIGGLVCKNPARELLTAARCLR